jgi:D-sedoheptulose 7-phosphate isomerase
MVMTFSQSYLDEVVQIARDLPVDDIERLATSIADLRDSGGRLFILGVGGGAGHASHAVNDFRKLCHLEAYAPTDNVSELTARTNDEGWDSSFADWLKASRLSAKDGLLVFSVGGGSRSAGLSLNIVEAVELAKSLGAKVWGIVGKPDGTTAKLGDICLVVPAPTDRLTPHVESFQAVIWHLLVFHPKLAAQLGRWESVAAVTGS